MDKNEKLILKDVGNTTLQEPVKIEVDIKPSGKLHARLQHWKVLPGKRVFMLHPITMGSLIRISKLLLQIDMNVYDLQNLLESNYKAISDHGETMATIVAVALQNGKASPSERLVQFILRNFTSKEMMMVLGIVVKQMDLTSFMSSIISVKGMNILESKTANAVNADSPEVSPSIQGS